MLNQMWCSTKYESLETEPRSEDRNRAAKRETVLPIEKREAGDRATKRETRDRTAKRETGDRTAKRETVLPIL